jgi:hypothetical protein
MTDNNLCKVSNPIRSIMPYTSLKIIDISDYNVVLGQNIRDGTYKKDVLYSGGPDNEGTG